MNGAFVDLRSTKAPFMASDSAMSLTWLLVPQVRNATMPGL